MTKEDKLAILAAARQIGFNCIEDGKLSCTLDQLCEFSSNVAASTAEQIIAAFKSK